MPRSQPGASSAEQDSARSAAPRSPTDVGIVVLDRTLRPVFADAVALQVFAASSLEELASAWPAWSDELNPQAAAPGARKTVRAGGKGRPGIVAEIARAGTDLFVLLVWSSDHLDQLKASVALAQHLRSAEATFRTFAHDVRGPLNSMTITLQLLLESLQRSEEGQPADRTRQIGQVQTLRAELRRLTSLVTALTSHLACIHGERRSFALETLVADVLPLLRLKAERQGVELRFTPPSEAVPVIGHLGSLKQAFMNVVLSGLEGRAGGGNITVRVDRDGTEGVLSVVDAGEESPSEPLERMAELEGSAEPAGGSLGLNAAREVLAAHGGRIALQTQPGRGCRIDLILPLNDGGF